MGCGASAARQNRYALAGERSSEKPTDDPSPSQSREVGSVSTEVAGDGPAARPGCEPEGELARAHSSVSTNVAGDGLAARPGCEPEGESARAQPGEVPPGPRELARAATCAGARSVGAPYVRPANHRRRRTVMTQDEYVHLAERLAQERHGQRISTYATLCSTPYPSEIERSDSKLSLATSSFSWATPCQTVVILDWDDTLFPTAWLRGKDWFEGWLTDSCDPAEIGEADRALLAELDRTVQSFMAAASCLGQLCIVTLAQRPWQAWSMQAFFPGLATSWPALGVKVRYAREERVAGASVHSKMVGRISDPETDAEQYMREQGTYARLKMKSMQGLLAKLYQERSWKNVVSIGDGPAERRALQELGLRHVNPTSAKSGRQKEFRIKTVQMAMDPSCEQLCGELHVLASWLPALVNLDADFDVDLNRSEEDLLDTQGRMVDLLERSLCGTL